MWSIKYSSWKNYKLLNYVFMYCIENSKKKVRIKVRVHTKVKWNLFFFNNFFIKQLLVSLTIKTFKIVKNKIKSLSFVKTNHNTSLANQPAVLKLLPQRISSPSSTKYSATHNIGRGRPLYWAFLNSLAILPAV